MSSATAADLRDPLPAQRSSPALEVSDIGGDSSRPGGDNSRAVLGVSRIATLLTHALLLVFSALMLVPFLWMITTAFRVEIETLFFPKGDGFLSIGWDRFTIANFTRLFEQESVFRALLNSVFLASVTSLGATLFAAMGGYGLSKFRFRGRGLLTNIVLAALIIPAPLLLAPGYQWLFKLGLLDTYAGLFLPGIAPAFGVFLFRQAMLNSVPGELIEAARIDGAGEVRIFFSLVLPLVRPMIGAFLMITFLRVWNDYINPQVVMQSPEHFPLSVALANLRGLYGSDYGLIMSGSLISIAPLMCMFLLLQKEFISGLTSGAVKG